MRAKWVAASAAICSMWIATLFIAIFAPELHATSAAGDATSLPVAGIVAAGVAFIATIVVAVQGFGGRTRDVDFDRERLEERIRELESRTAPHDEAPPQGRLKPLLHR